MALETSQYAIRARGLSKRFAAVKALSHIDLEVKPGEAVGLLGPNGAGKSTTLSLLMGLQTPDAGTVTVFGRPAGSHAARQVTGATPQVADFPDQITPRELLRYAAARYGNTLDEAHEAERFGLERLMDRRIAGFSGGERRRVALALAFAGRPKLVFLDEPTTGLDVDAQHRFHALCRAYVREGGALILTSHLWDEVEAICDAITFIDAGKTVLSGHVTDMRKQAHTRRLSFSLPAGATPPPWMAARQDGVGWSAEAGDTDTILRRMVQENVPFEGLTIAPLKLRDLIARIQKEGAAA